MDRLGKRIGLTGDKEDRYQYQPWYIKLWRRRYQLLVPFYFLNHAYLAIGSDAEFYEGFTFWGKYKLIWSIEMGMADVRMNWMYTPDETASVLLDK